MCNYFPFFSLTNSEFKEELDYSCKIQITDRLHDHGLRDYIYKLSSDQNFKSLDSSYYSISKFNNKFTQIKKNIELSIFHINIRSLNSKVRSFCELISLLSVDFDVLILSEIWSYNIEFYSNILDGYNLYTSLPSCGSIGGVGMFIKKSLSVLPRLDLNLSASPTYKVEDLWFEIFARKKNI